MTRKSNMTSKEPKAKANKGNKGTKYAETKQANKPASKIALWLYGFYCFFIVGVTYMRNDYYKKAIIP